MATYSPYIDISLWVNKPLLEISQESGIKNFTVAFILSTGEDKIGWGGSGDISENDKTASGADMLEQITALRADGGNVIISFGGEYGTPPAGNATSADALQSLYQMVVDRYGATSLDFDIEGQWVTDQKSLALRNEALLGLQTSNPDLEISFTLPVSTQGLTQDGLNVLYSAKDAGVDIDVVNIMAMCFGSDDIQGKTMSQGVLDSITSTESQLAEVNYGAKVGVTPMIGVNNASLTFSLDDAYKLAEHVASDGNVARMGIWSITRDKAPDDGKSEVSATHSGVSQNPYEFSLILSGRQTAPTVVEEKEAATEQEYYFGLLDPDDQYHYGLLDPDDQYHYGLLDPDDANQDGIPDATQNGDSPLTGLTSGTNTESPTGVSLGLLLSGANASYLAAYSG